MIPNPTVLSNHRQLYPLSCVPMSVELVLKLLDKLPLGDFGFQLQLGPNVPGDFVDYDGRQINGVTFKKEFSEPRGPQFPLTDLFERMKQEIAADRYVIVSLKRSGNWHMYVVHAYDPSTDEFEAVTVELNGVGQPITDVKRRITQMQGTDILTYTI